MIIIIEATSVVPRDVGYPRQPPAGYTVHHAVARRAGRVESLTGPA
jgi:hypothetical protein